LGVGGRANLFARVTIDNQQFVEAMQLDKETIRPDWTTIKFVGDTVGSTTAHYELWDEDTASDDRLDIHPDKRFENLDFFYNVTTHQMGGIGIEGIFGRPTQLFTTRGTNSDRAEVQFYITTKTLAEPFIPLKSILVVPPGGFKIDEKIKGTY
jgi:hypothetical protein